jgi:hypothetical protein
VSANRVRERARQDQPTAYDKLLKQLQVRDAILGTISPSKVPANW